MAAAIKVPNAGSAGVVMDLSQHELPPQAWTDASNIRFLDGYCRQFYGHGSVYGEPEVVPFHVVPVNVGEQRYWIYAGATKIYAVTNLDGAPTNTNLTRSIVTPLLAYNPLPRFGQLGINNGTSTNIGTYKSVLPFGDEIYSGLRYGTLNNAMSDHVAAPSFSTSALLSGLMTFNALPGAANLVISTATSDINYAGRQNQWTSTLLSGIPILNPGNLSDPPQQWNLDINTRFKTLDNWPANTYCKSMRAYKNLLVALNVTKNGVNYPYMVKFSAPADPGAVPPSWDETDPTQDAGEFDLATGGDPIIDGLELRNSLMVYKEQSVWRIDYVGGQFILAPQKVFGMSGAMNRNCIVEVDGVHFVLTGSDVVVHDGQTATSVLDKVARRSLFQDMDTAFNDRAFVFKNPFLNEVFVCYASIGASVPNKALVWNYKDRTVSYRTIPNLNHASYGTIDNLLSGAWSSDDEPWDTDLTAWNGPDFTPNTMRVLMASDDQRLFLLDASASFDGALPVSYLERRGLSMGDDEVLKTITSVRARIVGNAGLTVLIKIGGHNSDPYAEPEYPVTMTHVIGSTISDDGIVTYRYPAIRFESGTAPIWRLDSYDLMTRRGSKW